MTLNELKQEIYTCQRCLNLLNCEKTNMQPSIMTSNENAKILFIAQNPGVPLIHEKEKLYEDVLLNSSIGKLFLRRFMKDTGIDWQYIYWTNICKCPSIKNRLVTEIEMINCLPYLYQQVSILKSLKYVILLGDVVKKFFTDRSLNTNATIIYFYHPSYIYRTGNYRLLNKLYKQIKYV